MRIGKYAVAVFDEKCIEDNSYLMKCFEFGIANNIFVVSASYLAQSNSRQKSKYEKQAAEIIKSVRQNGQRKTMKVEGGEIHYDEKIVSQKPIFRDLNDDETAQINKNLELGKSIVQKSAEIELSDLDDFFKKWLENPAENAGDEIALGLGALFGEIAAEKLAMQWQIVTDEYGTDFCLVHKKTNTAIFPFSSVCKRIESKEYDFFAQIFEIAKSKIEGK